MNLYLITESHDTLKSLSLFLFAKSISNRNILKIKNYSSWLTFSPRRRIWSFHVVVLQSTAKKCTKNYRAHAQPSYVGLVFTSKVQIRVLHDSTTPKLVKSLLLKYTCYGQFANIMLTISKTSQLLLYRLRVVSLSVSPSSETA